MLPQEDLEQLTAHGVCEEAVSEQLKIFNQGAPFTNIVTAATHGNGINVINSADQKSLIAHYDGKKEELDVIKFVPASGAATRMFSFLHQFLDEYDPEEETLATFIKTKDKKALNEFFSRLKEFPFISQIRSKIRSTYPEYKKSNKGLRMYVLVKLLLNEDGLNFSNLPKGLVPFHKYTKIIRTAFEEQLFEATQYAASQGRAHVHFTFSPKHVELFKKEYEAVEKRLTNKTKVKTKISYSFQDQSTDTIAVTLENKPFRDNNGQFVFRPSGHGALLKNLNEVDADIIFIKNIDNVAVEEYVKNNAKSKKVLAGKLIKLQAKIFEYLKLIIQRNVTDSKLQEIKTFLWKELNIKDIPQTEAGIATILNRPIRVCGVVKNTGAPGGGPFWVKNSEGEISLQIVEMSQIDKDDERQWNMAQEATHFNPVDLVCGTRDYNGEPFDLNHFVDPEACFISMKTIEGTPIKALELPGLWNGSMANWNTVFVEVPEYTFSPVKTVNDLLSPAHKPLA
ncbi:DUF4301 family protein [Patiriisocius marinus]|uniref:DUF4301 family protein n=1 Tax=Patiriisocius marinus TaxID=1397112 RepID=UPI00232A9784|nr:DUF4301 family protein [Patiriisocius marinus]